MKCFQYAAARSGRGQISACAAMKSPPPVKFSPQSLPRLSKLCLRQARAIVRAASVPRTGKVPLALQAIFLESTRWQQPRRIL